MPHRTTQDPPRFTPSRALIGMVHVGALPGTPRSETLIDVLVSQAATEAAILKEAGFDAIIIENMHDTPYVHGDRLGPEAVAVMTRVAIEVAAVADLPLGMQILSGGNRHAVAACAAGGGSFIRCENFVFSHVADEGLLDEAEAGPLLRYRRSIDAEGIAIFADIKKKHASHAITGDIDVARTAEAAAFFGADGVIVTGGWTGVAVDEADLRAVRAATELPMIVGSGVTPENAAGLFEHADALIVGSSIKHKGLWRHAVDPARCDLLVKSIGR